ncbi:MAG TPA: glycosyltransferase family 2 protein [Chitinophagaceae bacterium]|nr:glycosyltransferase family 2 protein [Chitinophagaceae bacterium]
MKVSAFTFIRNAIKYDYPIKESILSILPIVDEYIVCVGRSEDDTLTLIENINSPKIKIMHSVWDESLREGGRVLAAETDKALAAVSPDADWLFYLQGDEVVHEQYLDTIKKAMLTYKDDKKIEGLLFHYTHFYGSYQYTGDGRSWYSKEIRVIRNDKNIQSWKDAQGFRKKGKKLSVKLIDACIYHYGWVKNPKFQQAKQKEFGKWWNDDKWLKKWQELKEKQGDQFRYEENIDSLSLFTGTHPLVMKQKVENENWEFEFDLKQKRFKNFRYRLLYYFEKITGIRPLEYRNYKKI